MTLRLVTDFPDRLAHDAQSLAGLYLDVEVVDRFDHTNVGVEVRPQVLELEDGLTHAHFLILGSRASRRPSPTRLSKETVMKIAKPGARIRCHAPEE